MDSDKKEIQSNQAASYTEKQVDAMLESVIRDLSALLDSAPEDVVSDDDSPVPD